MTKNRRKNFQKNAITEWRKIDKTVKKCPKSIRTAKKYGRKMMEN